MFTFYAAPAVRRDSNSNVLTGTMDLKYHIKRTKYLIGGLSIFEIVIGLVLLGLESYSVHIRDNELEKGQRSTNFESLLIAIAVISLINGAVGLIGSVKENHLCLTVHGILLLIGLIAGIVISSIGAIEYIWLPLLNTPRLVEVIVLKYLLKKNKEQELNVAFFPTLEKTLV
ncbi:hypothetical protein CHUAL_011137 [Chamberlinius hualienensis]